MFRHVRSATLGVSVLLFAASIDAADLGVYREFRLGATTDDVMARAGSVPRDVKTLHTRPALLQEIAWRPPYVVGRGTADRDSVAEITFSFVDNQLFKMAVAYDRARTQGLTPDDMIASLSALYGARSTLPAPVTARRPGYDSIDVPTVLARWRDGDTAVTLHQSTYNGTYSLVISSVARDSLARKAQATAVTMDAREAPARDAARVKAQADAARAAAAETRTKNKATFQP